MKKLTALVLTLVAIIPIALSLSSCQTEAERVSYNLSLEADNFNVVRRLTVINCIQNDVLFQMTGKMSITADRADNQLEILVEEDDGTYKKHFVGLSDNVTYVLEDVDTNHVSKYSYTINFNPNMWLPIGFDTVD